jgi:hypothetical protein
MTLGVPRPSRFRGTRRRDEDSGFPCKSSWIHSFSLHLPLSWDRGGLWRERIALETGKLPKKILHWGLLQ